MFIMLSVILAGSRPAFADASYKIILKTFDACGQYEALYDGVEKDCSSSLKFPFENNGKYAQIDADISIIDQTVTISFHSEGQSFSTALDGWEEFSEDLESFIKEPQVVKLYFPNPAIIGRAEASLALVTKPPNAFITAALIDIEPVSED